ncbi:helix-turn-helix domain-containing protein [Salinarimonas sp.]|uniref:helix-turn-helix domain-containing protein n=1 Tax=Salinarimonas sp. TaxID=2766526 RepID=UPI0032D8EC57
MPFREITKEEARLAFCREATEEGANVTECCARYGVSRTTGYLWLARYKEEGAAGLKDRSRRPRRHARASPPETVARVVAARQAHPALGPRKLREILLAEHGSAPAASTIDAILRSEGVPGPRADR